MNRLTQWALLPGLIFSELALATPDALTSSSTFAEAQGLWQSAQDISSTDINGGWRRVAVYEHKSCKNIMHGNSYDLTGIKNSDGSIFTLLFEGHQVQFLNVGVSGNTQGPYEINAKTAQFSSWAYDENTQNKNMTDQAYGSYNCRKAPENMDQLICAIGTHLVKNAASDPTFKDCSKLKTGLLVLFTRAE